MPNACHVPEPVRRTIGSTAGDVRQPMVPMMSENIIVGTIDDRACALAGFGLQKQIDIDKRYHR